jgi:hypothetical protein
MISTLILAAALGGCPGGVCPLQRVVERERSVVVKRVVEPARVVVTKTVQRVHRPRLLHRLFH